MAGGIFYNSVAQSGLIYNNVEQSECFYNNASVWKKDFNLLTLNASATVSQTTDGAGTPDNYGVARKNADGSLYVSAFNGGRAGWAYWTIGPFNTVGYSSLNIYAPVSVEPGANGVRVGNWYVKLVDASGNDLQWLKNDSVPTIPGTYDGVIANVNQYNGVYLRFGVQGTATAQGGGPSATVSRLLLQ